VKVISQKGRIVAAHERFNCICQVAPMCTPSNSASWKKTASRSPQPFCTAHCIMSLYFSIGRPFLLKTALLRGGSGPHLIGQHGSLDPPESTTQTAARSDSVQRFLANVNSRSRSLFAIASPSVVCLSSVTFVPPTHAGGSNFRQYFYGTRYLSHPLTSTENFTEIVLGEPLRRAS